MWFILEYSQEVQGDTKLKNLTDENTDGIKYSS